MVEWRTHLASLGAMFLALSLGMVIGLGLGADEGWTQRQQAALDRIEQELTASRRAEQALLARQRELVREMEHWRALVDRGLPLLAEGRLAHQRVALFAPGGRPPQELLDEIGRVLSFTHTYSGQALAGEVIEARGVVERHGDERWLIVGTTREAKSEYILSLTLLESLG